MADLRALPRVDDVVARGAELVARYGRRATTDAVRAALDAARESVAAGGDVPDGDALLADAAARLAGARRGGPRRVINAAGVIVHTNLGRAPLSAAAIAAIVEAAGACDLEIDLATGRRGSRGVFVDGLLAEATGAEDALAVNSCAAALVLVLAALAGGRDVVVSRGELVEIGGSFRLPDIMAAAGVRLAEVGTTNKTRAEDYAEAPGDVALLLKVHPSNFAQSGFTESVGVAELADVARSRGVPLVHDCGSGLLDAAPLETLLDEPTLTGSLRDGADLVLASGDKLLGGPQAGLIAGRADLVDACRSHPLARAVRLDKLRIAALVATLESHLRGSAAADLPVWAALHADVTERTGALAAAVNAEVVESLTLVGGGSAPGAGLSGPVVRLAHRRPDAVAAALRTGTPAVLVRVEGGAVLVDLRTVAPADDALVAERLLAALRPTATSGNDPRPQVEPRMWEAT